MSYIPSNTRMGQAVLDFGFVPSVEGDVASVSVAAPWVNQNSVVICQIGSLASDDHDIEDASIEGIAARASNIVTGVSFDIIAYAPQGTWGKYTVMYQGLISRNPS